MFTVALIGPDGAGKTTICRELQRRLQMPVKYLYMGVNVHSSNRMLPTTRMIRALKRWLGGGLDQAGPRDPVVVADRPRNPARRAARAVRESLSLINRMTEEWFRQGLAWWYRRRGHIVLFDRHYFVDYYAYDIAPTTMHRSVARKLHGFMLQRIYPKPQLVIYLDAPASVLFARKGEGSIELLERRRKDYLEMQSLVPCFYVVDASQPMDRVLQDVSQIIVDYYEKRTGRAAPVSPWVGLACAERDSRSIWPEMAVLDLKAEADSLHVDS